MLFESSLTVSTTNAVQPLNTGLTMQKKMIHFSFQTFRYPAYISCIYISILVQGTKVSFEKNPWTTYTKDVDASMQNSWSTDPFLPQSIIC